MKLLKNKLSVLLVVLLLGLAFFTHGINMFHFPYYENDEGVYMSQAWSVLTQGKLAPYTYWYDHAPMGWFTIALWTKVTGGFYTFGQSVNSGRVFMLFLQVVNSYLVFYITLKITRSIKNNHSVLTTFLPALLAGIIFAVSPLGIYFHRRILLDNIMTTFVLISYALLLKEKLTLMTVFSSAILFACGVLSKENAIFFIPGFFITLFARSPPTNRPIALFSWITIIGSIASVYFLSAILKGEFFPVGSVLGGTKPHVSLLTTLAYQTSRKGGGFFDPGTWAAGSNFRLWIQQDPILTIGGVIGFAVISLTTILQLIISGIRHLLHKKNVKNIQTIFHTQNAVVVGFLIASLGFFYFLGRGGIVIEFYIVPLLPFLSILIAVSLAIIFTAIKHLTGKSWPSYIFFCLVTCCIVTLYYPYAAISTSFPQQSGGKNIYTTDQTISQREALSWIRENIKEDEVLIFDNHIYLDLKDPKNPGKKVYTNSNWYWKVDLDPAIRDNVYNDNPENIDYVALTPQMNADLNNGVSPLTHEAVTTGHIVKAFDVNGWSVNIIRSTFPKQIMTRSWEWYKTAFIHNGRVIDPSQNISTSEGQSYAMLRAVWMNDQIVFDEAWNWTKQNLELPDHLFAWRFRDVTGINGPGDLGTAPDANIDIALSLLFASKQWHNDEYKKEATDIIAAIWNKEVGYMNGKPYLSAGNWAISADTIVMNPSYFSPYAFKIFSEVTPDIPWVQLVDSGYDVLQKCTQSNLNVSKSVFLPPEWCQINNSGIVSLPTAAGISSSEYSYNAFRVPFKLALDYQWYQDPRAKSYLGNMKFLFDQWQQKQKLVAIYTHDGQEKAEYEAVPAYAGSLGAFLITDPATAKIYYDSKMRGRFYEVDGKSFWDDPANYYTQNWGWLGTGLYSGRLTNLWK